MNDSGARVEVDRHRIDRRDRNIRRRPEPLRLAQQHRPGLARGYQRERRARRRPAGVDRVAGVGGVRARVETQTVGVVGDAEACADRRHLRIAQDGAADAGLDARLPCDADVGREVVVLGRVAFVAGRVELVHRRHTSTLIEHTRVEHVAVAAARSIARSRRCRRCPATYSANTRCHRHGRAWRSASAIRRST